MMGNIGKDAIPGRDQEMEELKKLDMDRMDEHIRSLSREEFKKLMAAEPEGKPFYVVRDADIKELIETAALGPWQRDMLIMWLDHLETWRRKEEKA